jgi:hypothetical protein
VNRENNGPLDVVPLSLFLSPKVVSQDEATTIEHGLHVGLVVLGIIGLQIIGHHKSMSYDNGHAGHGHTLLAGG